MAKQDKKDIFLPIDPAALIKRADSKPIDKTNPAAIPNTGHKKNEPFMVEKADGSIGQWGNDIKANNVPSSFRVYGGGSISGGDISMLIAKHRNDTSVMNILKRNIGKEGEVHMYSQDDADVIKKLIRQQDNQPESTPPSKTYPKQIL
jgi:hypothetical protein